MGSTKYMEIFFQGHSVLHYTASLTECLAQLGVKVHLLTDVPIKAFGVKVHYIPRLPTKPLKWVMSNYERILLIPRLIPKAEIIHTNIAGGADYALEAQKKLGKPVVHTAHGVPLPEIEVTRTDALRAQVEAEKLLNFKESRIPIVSISNFCKDILAKRLGISSQVIYHGVNFRFFNPNVSRHCHVGDILKKDKKFKYVLSITRMHPYKDPSTLIASIPEVIKDFPNVKFIIVGGGPLLNRIVDLSKKLNVYQKITLIDYLPFKFLLQLYSIADVFVHTGYWEFFGLAVLEAMACKKAVIVPDTGATPEIAGDACLKFRHADSTDLTEKILSLLSDDELRTKLAAKSFERSKEFTWEKAAVSYMQLYKSIS